MHANDTVDKMETFMKSRGDHIDKQEQSLKAASFERGLAKAAQEFEEHSGVLPEILSGVLFEQSNVKSRFETGIRAQT